MKTTALLIGLFLVFWGNAQQPFEKGQLIDSIPITTASDETFALYLPKTFNTETQNSIVFIFEPAARGAIGIQSFIAASETYGHILVCSNSIRNGPYNDNFEKTNRWFDQVFSTFTIAGNQVYLAGFSGGARLATTIAVLTDKITGVIACGASFSQNQSHLPTNQKFSFVGVCGNQDMNFSEMFRAREYLNKTGFTNTLITYGGDHSWPPATQLMKAFDWLAIQAHRKGYKTKNDSLLLAGYKQSDQQGQKALSEKQPLQAIESYDRIISTYGAFFKIDTIQSKRDSLKRSKMYKHALKKREAAFKKEAELSNVFLKRFRQDYLKPKAADYSWWRRELGRMNKKKGIENQELTHMATRVRFKIFAAAYERVQLGIPKPSEAQRTFCKELRKIIYPDPR